MYCIRARSSNTNSNNAKKQWIRWGQLYTHIPHLLFIERADWPKLHEMFKTRDARIRRRFQIRVWVFFVDAWLKPNFCHAHELIRPLDTGKKSPFAMNRSRILFARPLKETTRRMACFRDDVIKLKHFPRYWPFVRGIHRWQRPVTRSFFLSAPK